jgi:hypothetical protein
VIRCLAMVVLLLRALAPAGMCLPSRCLTMGIHVTVSKKLYNENRLHFERCVNNVCNISI